MADRKNAPCEALNKKSTFIIPEKIKNLKCFICHDKNKVPINPITGEKCSSAIQNRWGYLTALAGLKKHKNVTGIGVILGLTSIGNLAGIDIDNCIKNGKIAKEALGLIKLLDSYFEISPSGRGIHGVFLAKKSGKICKNSNLGWCKCIEIYDNNRYFTFTGNKINDKDINHRQKECDFIYKKYFEKQENPKIKYMSVPETSTSYEKDEKRLLDAISKAGKVKNIYEGIRPTADESSNDMTFCNLLRMCSNGNRDLMRKYFLNSPFFSSKDEAHKRKIIERPDYLKRTIDKSFD